MDAAVERLVRAIHAAPQQAVIYTTGGASQVCSGVASQLQQLLLLLLMEHVSRCAASPAS